MGITSNLIWYADGGFAYVATCTRCGYISPHCDDEDDTFRAWRRHSCRAELN